MKKNTTLVLLFLFTALCATPRLSAQDVDLVWAHQIGNNFNDKYSASTIDSESNIISVGQYTFTVDADPGVAVYDLDNDGRVFIQKLDVNGSFIWTKTFAPENINNLKAMDVATDKDDNIITLGSFGVATDFDPGEDEFILYPTGNYEAYIQKMDPDGNFLWAINFGGTTLNKPIANATDEDGNIYITGIFMGNFDFHPSPNEELFLDSYEMSSFASAAAYVMKISPDGEFLWAYSIPNDGKGGQPNDIKAAIDGSVYITGYFTANTDFGMASEDEIYLGTHDAYLVKYDTDGHYQWINIINSGGFNIGKAIAIDDDHNIYNVGHFSGSNVDFDPTDDGEVLLSTVGFANDIYIQKLNADGELSWAKAVGGEGADTPYDVSVEKYGSYNPHITGVFAKTVDFDPNEGVYELSTIGVGDSFNTNMFVQSLSVDGDFEWAVQVGNSPNAEPHSIVSLVDGGAMISGNFSSVSDFDPSDNTYDLIPSGLADGFIAKYIQCFDDNFALTEGILPTIHAECVVEVLPVPTANNSCAIFYNGTPDIELPITEEGDYSILWTYENNDGLMLTQSQELTVNFISTEILNMGDHLAAEASGYAYQWIDCNNGNYEIPGATNQNFYPETSGSYALKITNNDGCAYNSPCENFYAVNVSEHQLDKEIEIYPNPNAGHITINFNKTYPSLSVSIIDIMGSEVQHVTLNNVDKTNLDLDIADGWYFIEIYTESETIARRKILKN